MSIQPKIRIVDDSLLRKEIYLLYENTDQVALAQWSLSLAKHVLKFAEIDFESLEEIKKAFESNELWQDNQASVHDVRQAGIKIHRLARSSTTIINQTVLRVVGHAVSSGHMREHAMVASDYAVKVVGLISFDDMDKITLEREWQLNELKKFR